MGPCAGRLRRDQEARAWDPPVLGTTAGQAFVRLGLVDSNNTFLERLNRFDLRFARTFRFGGRYRIQGFADIFNVLNLGTVTRINETYSVTGTNAWHTPLAIQQARYWRFGTQMSF